MFGFKPFKQCWEKDKIASLNNLIEYKTFFIIIGLKTFN